MDQDDIFSQVSGKYQINHVENKFLAFIIIAVVLVVAISFILIIQKVFLKRIYPLVGQETQIYFEISKDSPLYNSSQGMSEIIAMLGDSDEPHQLVFEQLKKINGNEIGYLKNNDQSFWFIKNPEEEDKELFGNEVLIERGEDNLTLLVFSNKIGKSDYLLLGQDQWKGNISGRSDELLQIKKDLFKLSQKGNGLIYSLFSGLDNPMYGLIKSNNKLVNLQIVFNLNDLQSSYQTEEIISSDFFVETQQNSIPLFSLMPQLLAAGDSSVFQNSLPGKIYARGKSMEMFIQNPYSDDISWRWEGNQEVAGKLELGIQRDLAEQYPQIYGRILPDGSTIPELIRTEGQVFTGLSDGLAESGPIFTFPDGQIIKEHFGEDMVSLSQNWEKTEETVDNRCILNEIVGFGHLQAPFWDSRLWKKLEFSYNQHNLLLCFYL